MIENIKYKKLKRISPSQYYSMKNCTYKSVLAVAFDNKPLLPISPNAYLGTVMHRILELISKGDIKTELDFSQKFANEVSMMENSLRQKGYSYYIPLQIKIKDFGIKKIHLKKHLRNDNDNTSIQTLSYLSEQWFDSKDNVIGGKIDLIIENKEIIEIIDFKTGAITSDMLDDDGEVYQEIKPEYKEQLKLYAYLYYENTGKFPTKLSLVDLSKQKFVVEFTRQECEKLFEEAKILLNEVNSCIESNELNSLAKPSDTNCKYCLYRPACKYYLSWLPDNQRTKDVYGKLLNIKQFLNNNINASVLFGNKTVVITGIDSSFMDFLNANLNCVIGIYSLRNNQDNSYSMNIYSSMNKKDSITMKSISCQ